MVNHLVENQLAWTSAAAWQSEVTGGSSLIAELAISTFVILPLVLHTIWGLIRMKRTRPNLMRWFTMENLRFVVQRLSAIGVLLFIPAHLFLARIQPAIEQPGGHIPLSEFSEHMNTLPTLLVYLLGVLGVTFHLANGLWGFAVHMGWYAGADAQRRLRNVSIALFVVLLALGWSAIFAVRAAGAAGA